MGASPSHSPLDMHSLMESPTRVKGLVQLYVATPPKNCSGTSTTPFVGAVRLGHRTTGIVHVFVGAVRLGHRTTGIVHVFVGAVRLGHRTTGIVHVLRNVRDVKENDDS